MANLANLTINDTGNITLPVGTYAQRPASPTAAMYRYSTSANLVEYRTSSAWNVSPMISGGLVFAMDASITSCYPGTGTTVYDLSGLNNNGTLESAVYDGFGGGSFYFNNAIISTSYAGGDIATPTYEAVVYNTDATTSRYKAIIQNNNATDDALYLYPINNLGYWPCSQSSLAVTTNAWTYVCFSYDGSNQRYFVNGSTQTVAGGCDHATDFDYIRIGGISTGDGERWAGYIAIARVYNRALSFAEMSQNFNAVRARFGI